MLRNSYSEGLPDALPDLLEYSGAQFLPPSRAEHNIFQTHGY
jgi:hypothetical protein